MVRGFVDLFMIYTRKSQSETFNTILLSMVPYKWCQQAQIKNSRTLIAIQKPMDYCLPHATTVGSKRKIAWSLHSLAICSSGNVTITVLASPSSCEGSTIINPSPSTFPTWQAMWTGFASLNMPAYPRGIAMCSMLTQVSSGPYILKGAPNFPPSPFWDSSQSITDWHSSSLMLDTCSWTSPVTWPNLPLSISSLSRDNSEKCRALPK